jgi:hypothetical protein
MTSRTIGGLPLMDVESVEALAVALACGGRGKVKARGAFGRLMTPVHARMLGRRLEGAFTSIKRVLEGHASASSRLDERV